VALLQPRFSNLKIGVEIDLGIVAALVRARMTDTKNFAEKAALRKVANDIGSCVDLTSAERDRFLDILNGR
jgi:hypothetical protein